MHPQTTNGAKSGLPTWVHCVFQPHLQNHEIAMECIGEKHRLYEPELITNTSYSICPVCYQYIKQAMPSLIWFTEDCYSLFIAVLVDGLDCQHL